MYAARCKRYGIDPLARELLVWRSNGALIFIWALMHGKNRQQTPCSMELSSTLGRAVRIVWRQESV